MALNRRLFLLATCFSPPLAAATARPNVVLILADDMGWGDVGMNGCPDVKTPYIDSIAKQGIRFSQFYANAPECTPTRCALLTGRYQHRVGGLECAIGVGNIGRYDEAAWLQKKGELGLPASELTMGKVFKQAAYDTALIGKWHLGYDPKHWPDRHGFDHSFALLGGNADYYTHAEMREGSGASQLFENGKKVNPQGYLTDLLRDRAVSWLAQRTGKPFLLYLPFNAPHSPIQDPAEFDEKTGTAPHRQRDRNAFGAVVRRLDESIGAVLRQLDSMGAADNTIVLFTSDNGGDANGRNEPLRGKKTSVYEGGIRVPFAIRWPGRIAAGQTTSQLGMSMDILPTLLAAARLSTPTGRKLDGVNLLPVLEGKVSPFSRTVFWRFKRGEARRKAVRDGDWKYTFDSGKEELFHLGRDERESDNVLENEVDVAKRLRVRLAAWEVEVRAPRLKEFRP